MRFELFVECQRTTCDYYNHYWQMIQEVPYEPSVAKN
jgi:hypothetical protein